MSKLNRQKPFGQVFGDASHAYEQDGKQFDHEGDEITTDAKAAKPEKPAKAAKPEKTEGEQSQVDAQLQD